MKRPSLLIFFTVFTAIMLAACTQDAYRGMLVLDGAHTLGADDSVDGELLVLSGRLVMAPGAVVTGALYMMGGTVDVEGEVAGDINLIGGELILGPEALVGGNVHVGGGSLERDPQATVRGQVTRGLGVQLPTELALPEPTLAERFPTFLVQTALVLLLALFTAQFAPRGLARVSSALTFHPVVSGAMGALVGVVGLALFVLMAFTIVLIPVTLLGLLALGIAVVYGWLAFGFSLGRLLLKRRGWGVRLAALTGTLLFMLLLFALEFVPVLGTLLLILLSCMGLGAVFITGFGSRTFVPAVDRLGAERV